MVVRRGRLNCIIVVLISLSHISCNDIPIGEIVVSGHQGPTLKSNKEILFTVVGRKRISSSKFSQPLGIFHLLIIEPENAPIIGEGLKVNSNNGVIDYAQEFIIQKFPNDYQQTYSKVLQFTYGERERILQLGSAKYELRNGNLFLITLDQEFAVSIQQLPEECPEADNYAKALSIYKMRLPDNRRVQKVELD